MKVRRQSFITRKLRKLIPISTCEKGCIECCGLVPWNFWEKKQATSLIDIKEVDQIARVITEGEVFCPYSAKDTGCLIYNERPILCRIYGVSNDERIKCKKGFLCKKPLSIEDTSKLMREYIKTNPRLILKNLLRQLNLGDFKSYIWEFWGQ